MELVLDKPKNKKKAILPLQVGKFFDAKIESDFWNTLSFEEQAEIKKGIADLDNGKRIEYADFLKKIS